MIRSHIIALLLALAMGQPLLAPLLQLWASPACQMKCSRLGKDCCCRKKAAARHSEASQQLRPEVCGVSCRIGPMRTTSMDGLLAWGAAGESSLPAVHPIGLLSSVEDHTPPGGLVQRQRPPPLSHY
ncbi:MAG: hypothetical protein HY820_30505 [Acidobacteria bacterium]|nr:hypothetical protein [Acidobacteriota bacterium]